MVSEALLVASTVIFGLRVLWHVRVRPWVGRSSVPTAPLADSGVTAE